MKKLQVRNSILLFLTSLIWGCAFVAQSVGADYIEPYTFNSVRFLMGGVFLLPCIWFQDRKKGARADEAEKKDRRELLRGGICCGAALCTASNLQMFGIMYTSVGKSGFLTALYIVMVPLIGIFSGRKAGRKLWLAVAFALVGFYLLCMKSGDLGIGFGESMLLLGALAFSCHIMLIDYFTKRTDGVKMSCIQFFVCGLGSGVLMLLFESPSFSALRAAWLPLLYTGIFSSGIGYTLQIIGQKGMNPVVASLILSLESVNSAIAGWLFLRQKLTPREIAGCAVVFAAIILAQLPEKKQTGD